MIGAERRKKWIFVPSRSLEMALAKFEGYNLAEKDCEKSVIMFRGL